MGSFPVLQSDCLERLPVMGDFQKHWRDAVMEQSMKDNCPEVVKTSLLFYYHESHVPAKDCLVKTMPSLKEEVQ